MGRGRTPAGCAGYERVRLVAVELQAVTYRLWVNEERTVLVRLWANGKVEVATREHPSDTWGPPVYLEEEKT